MKKATSVFIIVFIVFNLIISATNLNAVVAINDGITTEAGYKEWDRTGQTKATIGGTERLVKAQSTYSSIGATSSDLANLLMILPMTANVIMTAAIKPQYIKNINNITDENLQTFKGIIETAPDNIDKNFVKNVYKKFSILNLILGYYEIFDIYFFDDVDEVFDNNRTFNSILKLNISKFYFSIRSIVLIISLVCLIYIGIRMAISTVSEDKARYKKLFRSWVVGFILIFILHYIVIFAMELSKIFQQIILQIAQGLEIQTDFESNIIDRITTNYTDTRGFSAITSVIIYWMMIYYQVKFFIMYMFRELEVAILIIIAPLITITYSIDKSGDGRSQVFNTWFKDLLSEIFLQNLHCIAYLVFIVSAGNISMKSPILAIVFLSALSRVEKVVKNVFEVGGSGIKDIKLPFLNK